MAEEARWPSWSKPATKGDVIGLLVTVNSSLVDVYIALSATERGDRTASTAALKSLSENVASLGKLVDEIGGRKDG